MRFLASLFLLGFLCLSGCFQARDSQPVPQVDYEGQGQYNVIPTPTTVQGVIQAKTFSGGKITVEARRSVRCKFGRCPVLGSAPVSQEILDAPGPYTLELPESAKDLMIIATYPNNQGITRIAHVTLQSDSNFIQGIDLSFDRPYPPLR